jgi:hypothetical protein
MSRRDNSCPVGDADPERTEDNPSVSASLDSSPDKGSSRCVEASDADRKPSPRGEGVERSETDEVSEAAAVGSAFAEDREPCIPPSDEGGVSQRLTEGERTTPQSRQASTAPLAQGSQGHAEASDADEKPSPRGEGVSQSETDEVSIPDVPEAEA